MANEVRTGTINRLAQKTIDYFHNEIHTGNTYFVNHSSTGITNTSTANILMIVGAKEAHMTYLFATNGYGRVQFREGVYIPSDSRGTALSPINRNRNWATTGGTSIYTSASSNGAFTGTMLLNRIIVGDSGGGSGANVRLAVGTDIREGTEWILKPSTTYMLSYINQAAVTRDFNLEIQYYEE